ncbi:methyltransferase domain-containing protein [Candidatus Woesearchaeota archaeon]|nr:methyltransferase domain-containing protein [Candidatus Woesearchaeota archaeon]
MTTHFYQLPKTEMNRLVDVMQSYLQKQLLKSLGSRKLSEEELRELAIYWTATLISGYEKVNSEELAKMSDEETQRFFLEESGTWDRGIEEYSKMAGAPLVEIINAKLKKKDNVELLDIGCGQAVFLREIQDKLGTPIVGHAVSNQKQNVRDTINFRLSIAEVLPEEWTDKFDLVTCFEASMYFWDQNRAFNEALRVLAPDGNLFYGTNNLKTSSNEVILQERLGLEDFVYTCPETSKRAGEVYQGVFGKYISKFIPFMGMLKSLADEQGRFEMHGKVFEIKSERVLAWCPEVLQVKALGYK